LFAAALIAVGLTTFTVFAQQGEAPLRVAAPAQLRIISGHEARGWLGGASADFGTDERSTAAGTKNGVRSGPSGSGSGPTLPLWSYSTVAAQNGRSYSGLIVGGSPSTPATTNVATVLVPVIVKITQAGKTYTFDPTANDVGCLGSGNAFTLTQKSPLFDSSAAVIAGVGPTQYTDAVLKAEFWNMNAGNSAYHVLLNPPILGPALTITVSRGGTSTAEVYSVGSGQCGNYSATTNPGGLIAVVNVNTVDSLLQSYISAHGLNASQLPVFVTYNAVMSAGAANNLNNCCILGYHNALGTPGQTYAIAEFEGRDQTVFSGVSDVAAASHELAEWINDPTGTNPTPAWGNIGQVSSCQSNFEDGDPLTGTLMPAVTVNGFTFHLQELAYFSWFYGATPSVAFNGQYSSNGTFHGYSKLCPPGGTH
jgi:hypothetical protein